MNYVLILSILLIFNIESGFLNPKSKNVWYEDDLGPKPLYNENEMNKIVY